MMILQVILEGIGLGALLILVCAIGIRKGAVGMVQTKMSRTPSPMPSKITCKSIINLLIPAPHPVPSSR